MELFGLNVQGRVRKNSFMGTSSTGKGFSHEELGFAILANICELLVLGSILGLILHATLPLLYGLGLFASSIRGACPTDKTIIFFSLKLLVTRLQRSSKKTSP